MKIDFSFQTLNCFVIFFNINVITKKYLKMPRIWLVNNFLVVSILTEFPFKALLHTLV